MKTTKSAKPTPPLPAFPERFSTPVPGEAVVRPSATPIAHSDERRLKRQYRKGPFYLKIDGLEGPRPKYDEFGRLVPSGTQD